MPSELQWPMKHMSLINDCNLINCVHILCLIDILPNNNKYSLGLIRVIKHIA